MITIKVDVTQDDIDTTPRKDGRKCAVWRAMSRVHTSYPVHIGVDAVRAGGDNYAGMWLAPLPGRVSKWIEARDSGKVVGPISFKVDLPELISSGLEDQ
jgi:hypothetical protein